MVAERRKFERIMLHLPVKVSDSSPVADTTAAGTCYPVVGLAAGPVPGTDRRTVVTRVLGTRITVARARQTTTVQDVRHTTGVLCDWSRARRSECAVMRLRTRDKARGLATIAELLQRSGHRRREATGAPASTRPTQEPSKFSADVNCRRADWPGRRSAGRNHWPRGRAGVWRANSISTVSPPPVTCKPAPRPPPRGPSTCFLRIDNVASVVHVRLNLTVQALTLVADENAEIRGFKAKSYPQL